MSKAIDKAAGAERSEGGGRSGGIIRDDESETTTTRTIYDDPVADDAKRWQGWGTALKPAHEPIIVARKPLAGTVASNVLEYGTAALNIDACRIGFASDGDETEAKAKNRHEDFGTGARENQVFGKDERTRAEQGNYDAPGRWPANVILLHLDGCVRIGAREVASDGHFPGARPNSSVGGTQFGGYAGQEDIAERHTRGETQEVWECEPGCPVAELDAQSGERVSGWRDSDAGTDTAGASFSTSPESRTGRHFSDTGGASRFFYCAKVSRAERNAGLGDDFAKRPLNWSSGEQSPGTFQAEGTEKAARNNHPTVKPIALMRWLIRLVCPPGGVVLDPFLGSGSTGCAAVLEDCVGRFVGIERDPDYMRIAEARIAFWQEHGEDGLRIVAEYEAGERRRREVEDAGQLDIFGAS